MQVGCRRAEWKVLYYYKEMDKLVIKILSEFLEDDLE